MSHDPTSMNRRELQEYIAELLAFHDQQKETISRLDAENAVAKKREIELLKWKETVRDLFDKCICSVEPHMTPAAVVAFIEEHHREYFCGALPANSPETTP